MIRFLVLCCCVWLSCLVPATQAEEKMLEVFKQDVHPVLKALCFDCHGPKNTKGGLRFDELDPDMVNGTDAETWHDVLDQLNAGAMPPAKATQPTAEQRKILTGWILSALRRAAESKRFKDGRVLTRRLTRYEYSNTMRDLLGIDLDYARDLPPDPSSGEGFRNNGATLEMSPTQMETYLEVARSALAEVIVTGDPPKTYAFSQDRTARGKLPTKKVAGHDPVKPEFILDLKEFPRHGEFELRVTARAAIPGMQSLPRMRISMGHVPGIVHVPRKVVGEVDVSSTCETYTFRGRMEDFPQPGPKAFGNSGFKGMIVMVDFLDAEGNELRYSDRRYPQSAKSSIGKKKGADRETEPHDDPKPVPFGARLDIEVVSARFEAPVYASWPPPSHQRWMRNPARVSKERQYIREIIPPFMTSAFRRPVTDDEVEQAATLFERVRPECDSLEDAVRETFASVLVSPHFLYLVETRESTVANGQAIGQSISGFELASRLSFFLWSSTPDSRLLDLAAQGRLHDPKVIEEEVSRMLADDRSSEFVKHFVGQWLDMDALDRVAVNPEFYPDFEEELKRHMRMETQSYFAEILYGDRNALDLLVSDWAMLNFSMAQHYGLVGPRSSRFERVSLQDTQRPGGLLGQAAFLLANSNGEDSHPIKRAVWILDRLLDSPPAPPPPEVPLLDPESPDLAKLTLKQQLAVHRKNESCKSCHEGIDPWGVPLENFDAIGRWRTKVLAQAKRPEAEVDVTSVLPDGTEITGIEELQHYLRDECGERFARSLVKRLMAYGLGRSLDFADREETDKLTQHFIANDFRLKSLIIEFVKSESFQTK